MELLGRVTIVGIKLVAGNSGQHCTLGHRVGTTILFRPYAVKVMHIVFMKQYLNSTNETVRPRISEKEINLGQ